MITYTTLRQFIQDSGNTYRNINGKLDINVLVKDYQKTAYKNSWPLLDKELIRMEANKYYEEVNRERSRKYDQEMSAIFYDMAKKGILNFN